MYNTQNVCNAYENTVMSVQILGYKIYSMYKIQKYKYTDSSRIQLLNKQRCGVQISQDVHDLVLVVGFSIRQVAQSTARRAMN